MCIYKQLQLILRELRMWTPYIWMFFINILYIEIGELFTVQRFKKKIKLSHFIDQSHDVARWQHIPQYELHTTTHCILHTVYYTLYITHCILHTIYYTLYTTHCILLTVYYTLYTTHSVYSLYYTLYTTHSVYSLYYTMYTTHCTMHNAKCTLYLIDRIR